MASPERSPLLAPKGKARATDEDDEASETAPLLSTASTTPRYDGDLDEPADETEAEAASADADPVDSTKKKKRVRWPSILAISLLIVIAIFIILLAFLLPSAVEEYAKEAAVLEPTGLSLESITADGVRARIQVSFRLDGSRVKDPNSRRLGRFSTWVVRKLGTDQTQLSVYSPQHYNSLLGSAVIPPLVIDIVDGHSTLIDFVAELSPGDASTYRSIANQWLEGNLDRLEVLGKADISLKSGIFPLGTHPVAQKLVLEANEIPDLPSYNITRLNLHDVDTPGDSKGAVGADISVTAFNSFPLSLEIPELGFEVLVPNCDPSDHYIGVADVLTKHVTVRPNSDVVLDAQGLIRGIPKSLTRVCPNEDTSPLDNLIHQYMKGKGSTVYVRGKRLPESKTPAWISDILSQVTVPVSFPGHGFDNFVREFSLSDVDFKLPSPFADPDDPDDDGNPRVSGTIEVLAALPKEMGFEVNVTDLRAFADVYYKKQKMGTLLLDEWNPANSTMLRDERTGEPLVKIQSRVEDVPLNITDSDVLSEVMQEMFFGDKPVMLDVDAKVDTKLRTALGALVFKDIPAEGRVPVKPLPGDALSTLSPRIGEVKMVGSTSGSIELEALVNITNPTSYTAWIPYININIAKNGSVLGSATARNMNITKGNNTNLFVTAVWSPSAAGEHGAQIGSDLISQYLSGYNVTVDVKAHRDSIPSVPLLGEALSKVNLTVPAPRIDFPGEGEEDNHFIRDATFHVLSSTATFTLLSPLKYNTIYIEMVNATAYYNHTEPVGRIDYDVPFAAFPGSTETPRLPVEWSAGSVGYDAVKKALGGVLKLDAAANVTVRIGSWRQTIWYTGRGIGAHIRL